ncbi:MAG: L-fuculose-phosphate aldolase [Chloroflexota bacterium]|nr:L-fuculose-phosphate aldolase [Chloroflexota bacterium]
MIDSFQLIGRDMYLTGLVSSHSGSLSVRDDGQVHISRRGAMLGHLDAEDLLGFGIEDTVPDAAPDEVLVHQAIYRQTDAHAVIFARPPSTMALSLIEDRLSPAADEGVESLGSVPVLISQRTIASPDIAQIISRTLRDTRVVALRGHGVFARGEDLADALRVLSLLEEMCTVAHIYRSLVGEERQPAFRERQERQPQQNTGFRGRIDGGNRQPGRPPQQRTPSGPPRRNDGGGNNNHRPPNENRTGAPSGPRRPPPPHR